MKMLEIKDLFKNYGEKEVLKGISFEVEKGEVFALLGTNGAGKTTTLECIENLREYHKGTIQIHGSIGVQLQSSSLPENIQVIEAMNLFSKWKHVDTNIELMHHLGLKDLFHKRYKELSTGQKRRLHLAMALIGDPDIIFLDEPTAGLDVEGRVALHDEIRMMKEKGKTIIMASHDMAEIEELCDRIGILKDGKLAYYGTIAQLKSQIQDVFKVHIQTSSKIEYPKFKHGTLVQNDLDNTIFDCESLQDFLQELILYINDNKHKLLDVQVEHPSLEQRFMDIAKEA